MSLRLYAIRRVKRFIEVGNDFILVTPAENTSVVKWINMECCEEALSLNSAGSLIGLALVEGNRTRV